MGNPSNSFLSVSYTHLSPDHAAKISGLGVNRIRQLMEDGQLEYLPVGNRRLTTVQALLDYYKRAKVPAAA